MPTAKLARALSAVLVLILSVPVSVGANDAPPWLAVLLRDQNTPLLLGLVQSCTYLPASWRSPLWSSDLGAAFSERIREISGPYGIPERYLVQILLQLKGAGLVQSTRGAAGGYRLARSATKISLGEILAAIDGPENATRVAPETRRSAAAVLDPVWESVRAAERAVLDRTTIAQLAEHSSPHEWII